MMKRLKLKPLISSMQKLRIN